ncbi:hypothetical protein IAU59_007630 [Kwoniella sp. CBS 9459]
MSDASDASDALEVPDTVRSLSSADLKIETPPLSPSEPSRQYGDARTSPTFHVESPTAPFARHDSAERTGFHLGSVGEFLKKIFLAPPDVDEIVDQVETSCRDIFESTLIRQMGEETCNNEAQVNAQTWTIFNLARQRIPSRQLPLDRRQGPEYILQHDPDLRVNESLASSHNEGEPLYSQTRTQCMVRAARMWANDIRRPAGFSLEGEPDLQALVNLLAVNRSSVSESNATSQSTSGQVNGMIRPDLVILVKTPAQIRKRESLADFRPRSARKRQFKGKHRAASQTVAPPPLSQATAMSLHPDPNTGSVGAASSTALDVPRGPDVPSNDTSSVTESSTPLSEPVLASYSSVTYTHESKIATSTGAFNAKAAEAISTAIIQLLSANESFGTWLATASVNSRFIRILAVSHDHVVLESNNKRKTISAEKWFRDSYSSMGDHLLWDLQDSSGNADWDALAKWWSVVASASSMAADISYGSPISKLSKPDSNQSLWREISANALGVGVVSDVDVWEAGCVEGKYEVLLEEEATDDADGTVHPSLTEGDPDIHEEDADDRADSDGDRDSRGSTRNVATGRSPYPSRADTDQGQSHGDSHTSKQTSTTAPTASDRSTLGFVSHSQNQRSSIRLRSSRQGRSTPDDEDLDLQSLAATQVQAARLRHSDPPLSANGSRSAPLRLRLGQPPIDGHIAPFPAQVKVHPSYLEPTKPSKHSKHSKKDRSNFYAEVTDVHTDWIQDHAEWTESAVKPHFLLLIFKQLDLKISFLPPEVIDHLIMDRPVHLPPLLYGIESSASKRSS